MVGDDDNPLDLCLKMVGDDDNPLDFLGVLYFQTTPYMCSIVV